MTADGTAPLPLGREVVWCEGVGADPNDETDTIPTRFLNGCLGDEEMARERWQLTKTWRVAYGTDNILDEPQPHFGFLKRMYPHFVQGRSKTGQLVYFEQPGKCDVNKLWKSGVSLDEIARHYIFTAEFMWRILDPNESAQQISVFDISGATFSDLYGNALKLFRKCSELIQQHYPERSNKIVVINAPFWFKAAFSMVSPFIDPRTKKKITVCGSSYKSTLLQLMDPHNLPKIYGGEMVEQPEPERILWDHVRAVHKKHGVAPPDHLEVDERARSAPPRRDSGGDQLVPPAPAIHPSESSGSLQKVMDGEH